MQNRARRPRQPLLARPAHPRRGRDGPAPSAAARSIDGYSQARRSRTLGCHHDQDCALSSLLPPRFSDSVAALTIRNPVVREASRCRRGRASSVQHACQARPAAPAQHGELSSAGVPVARAASPTPPFASQMPPSIRPYQAASLDGCLADRRCGDAEPADPCAGENGPDRAALRPRPLIAHTLQACAAASTLSSSS